MKFGWELFALSGLCLFQVVTGFGGSEEKFIKKYAMMKVYESCFGPQVLKEIRKEMKEAAQKCSGFQPDFDGFTHTLTHFVYFATNYPLASAVYYTPMFLDKYLNHEPADPKPILGTLYQDKPFRVKPNLGNKVKKPIHTTDTLLLQQWAEEQKLTDTSDDSSSSDEVDAQGEGSIDSDNDNPQSSKKPIDFSKLEEAIMNIGRPMGQLGHRPLYTPTSQPTYHQPSPSIGYYPAMYYPPPAVPFAAPPPAHSYPYHAYYPGFFQAQAGAPAYPTYFRASRRSPKITKDFDVRMRKDNDIRAQIDAMTFHSGAKMRNITCVMQELGYLDDHLEPNYDRIMERITRLNVPEELRRDMMDGVKFCRQFSQCVPETRKDKFQLSKELLRPMFFFRCYKHKKLESCIMKDVRERFSQSGNDENNPMNNELQRSFKNNDLASAMFEFMYGTNSEEFESLL